MGFIRFFVKNWQFTLIVFLTAMVLGINALINMPRGEDPPFGAPIFSIVVVYPGTNPNDMEKLIADPIETELYKLSDIKKINTVINDGIIVMLAEFNYSVNVESKNNDVIREINKIRPELPEGIALIDIKRASSSDVVILQAAIVSDTTSFDVIRKYAEDMQRDLERIKSIKWVEIQALPEKEIRIELNLDQLAVMGLSVNQVLGLIQAGNINLPSGDIDLGNRKFNIKTSGAFTDIQDIRSTIVQVSPDGRTTRLDQIANIYETSENQDYIARHNGRRAIWLNVAMKDNENIISTRQEIEEVIQHFESKLPSDIQLAIAFDQEKGVRHRLSGLGRDFAIAISLVLLTLLPLGNRASLVVMISIPLSLSIGLFMLNLLGYTLNQLSIVGMVISLGLLVDDSIIVVENIERHIRNGMAPYRASIVATKHILVALFGCTATLLLAFLPLANMPEGSGDFIRSLPVAVMLTVTASLFVSLTIIPFLSSLILKPDKKTATSSGNRVFDWYRKYINDPYQRLLTWCLGHKFYTLLGAAIIFFSSLLLIPVLGFSLFPESEKPIVVIDIETEPGSNLLHTDRVTRKIEQKLLNRGDIDHISTNVGKGNPRIYYNEFQSQNAANHAQIIAYINPKAKSPEIQQFAESVRREVRDIPGVHVEVKRFQQGPPISAPIEMRIIGNHLDTLERLSGAVENIIRSMPASMYVRNNLKYTMSDIKIDIDRQKAGMYGLNAAEISKTVRLAIAGLNIGEITDDNGNKSNIRVTIPENTENALDNIYKIHVTSASGALVPLLNIAKVAMVPSPSSIRHFNKERYALISSFVHPGKNISQMTDEILAAIDQKIDMPEGYKVIAAGERESQKESFAGLGTIFTLTIFGLLAILILEFRKFKSTLIVLSVIPMGIIGALVALFFAGETLSFVATVGIIALMGIEIKNSILMVDYTNGLREEGMGLYEAVLDGAETRFLPILLTSLTAIGGLTPLVLENSPLISPLAIVLIGGLISSTLLSRLVTPILYYMIPPSVTIKSETYAEG